MCRYWIVRYLVYNEEAGCSKRFTRLEDFPTIESARAAREEMIAQGMHPVAVWIEEVF